MALWYLHTGEMINKAVMFLRLYVDTSSHCYNQKHDPAVTGHWQKNGFDIGMS